MTQFKSFALSDMGFYRKKNEDAFALIDECAFFVLADGIGGHPSGDVAAKQAVKTLCELIKEKHVQFLKEKIHIEKIKRAFKTLIHQTNEHVFTLSQSKQLLLGMGTTLACAYFFEEFLVYAHVGDSRIYRIRENELEQLTQDHSYVQELLDQGLISETESKKHVKRNVITKAIGTKMHVQPSIQLSECQEKDIYLLCSDGLHDVLTNGQMEEIINRSDDLEIAANLLINAAKRKGSRDNITVLFIEKQ
ncbi:MAG: Serine/threonine phosphatase stp [Chlamydiae bacterium]|nr:Serine/threonine phosphatase stp [Chlamydiota bacterium]